MATSNKMHREEVVRKGLRKMETTEVHLWFDSLEEEEAALHARLTAQREKKWREFWAKVEAKRKSQQREEGWRRAAAMAVARPGPREMGPPDGSNNRWDQLPDDLQRMILAMAPKTRSTIARLNIRWHLFMKLVAKLRRCTLAPGLIYPFADLGWARDHRLFWVPSSKKPGFVDGFRAMTVERLWRMKVFDPDGPRWRTWQEQRAIRERKQQQAGAARASEQRTIEQASRPPRPPGMGSYSDARVMRPSPSWAEDWEELGYLGAGLGVALANGEVITSFGPWRGLVDLAVWEVNDEYRACCQDEEWNHWDWADDAAREDERRGAWAAEDERFRCEKRAERHAEDQVFLRGL